MALNEALTQYMKCYDCSRYAYCDDVEAKVKEAFNEPMLQMIKYFPSDGISGQPYKSKYFDDHRYDPPKPLTICDIERCLMEGLHD